MKIDDDGLIHKLLLARYKKPLYHYTPYLISNIKYQIICFFFFEFELKLTGKDSADPTQ